MERYSFFFNQSRTLHPVFALYRHPNSQYYQWIPVVGEELLFPSHVAQYQWMFESSTQSLLTC
jgi:hypothetical protein